MVNPRSLVAINSSHVAAKRIFPPTAESYESLPAAEWSAAALNYLEVCVSPSFFFFSFRFFQFFRLFFFGGGLPRAYLGVGP